MGERVHPRSRRPRLASPTVASILGLFVALALAAFAPILALARQLALGSFTPVAVFLPCAVVGFVIARRRPGNPIGWLLLAGIGAGILGTDAGYYAWAAYGVRHGLPLDWLAVLVGESWWIILLFAFPLVILLFPDGLPVSRSCRRIIQAFVCLAVISLACALALAATALVGHHVNAHTVNNGPGGNLLYDLPANTHWLTIVPKIFDVAVALMVIAAVTYQMISFRRSGGIRRQQLKWLLGGGLVCMLAIALLPTSNPGNSLVSQVWSQVPWAAFSALPISIAVAVLRYRLYDIGRLVSRTLSYVILSALLAGTFIGLIALTTNTLALSGRVGVAASTLASAALFNPLRVRIQRLVDRRFNRTRYNAEATVAAFTSRLRDAVEIDVIHAELLDCVNRAVQPTHVSLWIKQ